MRRRDFIKVFAGSVTAWPLSANAQQPGGMRRIGVIAAYAEHDPEAQARVTAFRQALQDLGWTEGGNVVIEYRWGAGDADRARTFAAELTALKPE
jgi:putative tryptophan/tyrosine transport system substrate-binding protein